MGYFFSKLFGQPFFRTGGLLLGCLVGKCSTTQLHHPPPPFKSLCVCVCSTCSVVYTMYLHEFVCMPVGILNQHWESFSVPILFLSYGLSLNLELASVAQLAGQRISVVVLPPPFLCQDSRCTPPSPAFYTGTGDPEVSMLVQQALYLSSHLSAPIQA